MQESSKTEQERVVAEAATPGGQLRKAREQAQLTVAVVADELKLTVAYIEALEDDHFEDLPAEPFVLGYLRAYARLLGLDAQQLVESYHDYCRALLATAGHLSPRRVESKPAVELAESSVDSSEQTSSNGEPSKTRYGWLIAALSLLLWVAASVLMSEASAPQVSFSAAAPQQGPVSVLEASAAVATQLKLPSESSVEQMVDAEAVTAEDSSSVSGERATAVDVEVDSETTANSRLAGLDTLQLDFIDECWLEVTDSRGDVLNADLYQAGDSTTLLGQAPFNVMLGNVRAVNARLNDEVLQLNPNGFRKTLRLRIASVSDIEVLSSSQNAAED